MEIEWKCWIRLNLYMFHSPQLAYHTSTCSIGEPVNSRSIRNLFYASTNSRFGIPKYTHSRNRRDRDKDSESVDCGVALMLVVSFLSIESGSSWSNWRIEEWGLAGVLLSCSCLIKGWWDRDRVLAADNGYAM